ncbi:hypothetical protein [Meridianimarinicoccus sp. MJW13]|uniref:hypothetical protein n=1 Tax=Meridianimarinicoccus sp. MJW13 TaxID=2720031 RepID=UPI0018687F69|nr:hypothetical protein [Fluviibacterium sp. MJW13]
MKDIVLPRPIPKLTWFESAVEQLSKSVPPPVDIRFRGTLAYRFEEKLTEQAVLLKAVRYVSGLGAGRLLLQGGYLQELGVIQRTLDEIHEDILFLAYPLLGHDSTGKHDEYLDAFWMEEPETTDYQKRPKNKHQTSRKDIRNYVSKVTNGGKHDHVSIAASGYLYRVYSGFVHAAAPHVLELYDPELGKFQLLGYTSSPLLAEHADDFENQFYRGVISIGAAAAALGDKGLYANALDLMSRMTPHFQDRTP